jgi:hypothetical protein
VAHDFFRVSALRDAMEYCCAFDMLLLLFLYFKISALRRSSSSRVLYTLPAFGFGFELQI